MIDEQLLAELRRIVGDDYLSTSRAETEVYSYDASPDISVPGAVVLPADTLQIAEVVRAAAEARGDAAAARARTAAASTAPESCAGLRRDRTPR